MKKLIAALIVGLFASTAFTSSYAEDAPYSSNKKEEKKAKNGKKSKKDEVKKEESPK